MLSVSADRLLFLMNIQHLNGPSRGLWANIAPLFRALIFYVTARYPAMQLISSTVKEEAKSVYPLAYLLSTASSLQQLCIAIRIEIQGKTFLITNLVFKHAWLHIISCAGSGKQTFNCLHASPANIISLFSVYKIPKQNRLEKNASVKSHFFEIL